MRKGIMWFGFFILLCAAVPVAWAAPGESKIVATVNGIDLTEADLNQEINVLMPMNQSYHGRISDEKMDKIRAEAMTNLIDSELRAQDAAAKGMKISPEVLEEEVNKIAVKYKSTKDFWEAVQNAGFTEKSFKRIMQRKRLAEKILLVEVDNAVATSPEKVKKHYTANVSKYSKPEEFRASHILVKVDPAATAEEKLALKAKAESMLKRIKAGESFEAIASNESDDMSKVKAGDVGYFHAGQTIEEFEAELLKLKVGEISNVVESIYGFHIIRLTDKRAPRLIPFEEIKDKLQKDLIESEKKNLLESWMGRLYKKAKISYPGAK